MPLFAFSPHFLYLFQICAMKFFDVAKTNLATLYLAFSSTNIIAHTSMIPSISIKVNTYLALSFLILSYALFG